MLLAARCRAALLVLHVFFIMLVCSVYFTIPTGQRDAVGCTLSCCAAGFACFFYYVSMLNIFHNSNGAARCCLLHAVVLRCWFFMFFYYVSMLSIFHNSNGAARCCWLHAVVLRCWFYMFFLIC